MTMHDHRQQVSSEPAHQHSWFDRFAQDDLLPRLKKAAAFAKEHGARSRIQITPVGEKVIAELIIDPPGLPPGARPPRLTLAAAEGARRVNIDFTGTFPRHGAPGGFEAEIDYDTIFPEQVQDTVDEFLGLALG